jgi:hypothetical protein
MTRSILAVCMVAVSLSAPAAGQPLTYLHGDIADSPIAYQCIVNGAPTTCSVPIVPYCEKHKDQILHAPPLAQTCIRAEQAEEQRRQRRGLPSQAWRNAVREGKQDAGVTSCIDRVPPDCSQ